MTSSFRETAADLIERVLAGDMSPLDARTSWPHAKGDHLLDQAYHQLFHFEDDAEIRARDARYAEWQIALMRKFINQLRCTENPSHHQNYLEE